MKGTELTDDQIRLAREFYGAVCSDPSAENVRARKVDIIRLVAWFGAIRYQAAQADGASTKPVGRKAIRERTILK